VPGYQRQKEARIRVSTPNSQAASETIVREENMNIQFKSTTVIGRSAAGQASARSTRLSSKSLLGVALLSLLAAGQLLTVTPAALAQSNSLESAITCQDVHLQVSLAEGQAATYQVVGQLCYRRTRSNVVHLLVSGATYGHIYWDFPQSSPFYSYVRALTGVGYSTLNIDRIGIGQSDHPPADQTTIQADAWVIHQVVQALRDGRIGSFSKVILVGHSLGSGISLSEQARYGDADGLILSGFLHAFGPGFAGLPAILYPAQNDPRFAGQNIPDGYFTSLPGTRPAFYFTPLADPNVIALDESTKETITIGEINTFPPLVLSPTDAQAIHVPVLVTIGANDNVFCTPPQCPEAQAEAAWYPADANVEVKVVPGSGHDLNLHYTAPAFFLIAAEWSARHFGR